MARAMGTNAYGKEPRRGERTLSRGFTHRRARRAFLRLYGAGASLGRSHRAYALGYFLAPLTGLRTAHAQDWHDAKNSASRRSRGLPTCPTIHAGWQKQIQLVNCSRVDGGAARAGEGPEKKNGEGLGAVGGNHRDVARPKADVFRLSEENL